MLSRHERRKRVSSAPVIWYTVLFRQNRTDRPYGVNVGIIRRTFFRIIWRMQGEEEQDGALDVQLVSKNGRFLRHLFSLKAPYYFCV
jgi:hypothetical protein